MVFAVLKTYLLNDSVGTGSDVVFVTRNLDELQEYLGWVALYDPNGEYEWDFV